MPTIDDQVKIYTDHWGALKQYFDVITGTYQPNLIKAIGDLKKSSLDTQKAFDAYKQLVLMKLGPLGLIDWEKETYRGFPLDLTGYVETFRDDFTNQATITGKNGAGPWYTAVHSSEESSKYYDLADAPELYKMTNGVLTLRLDKTPAGVWRAPIIQTMKADGTGFSQAKGVFEARIKFPTTAGYPNMITPGFWGGFWTLSAADFHPEITDHLTEIDQVEAYGGDASKPTDGGDKGIHTSMHYKPRRVPLPNEYPDRVKKTLYTNPETCFNTIGGARTFPATTQLHDNQFHTYTMVIDDAWATQYFDGLSIGRFPNVDGVFSTPQYMLLSSIRNPNIAEPNCVSPADMQVEYCRALKKS